MRLSRVLLAGLLATGCGAKQPPASNDVHDAPIPATPKISAMAPAFRATESAGIAVASIDGRKMVFVADADDHAIVALDAATLAPVKRVDVGVAPRDLLVTDGGELLATLPEANVVAVLDGSLEIERRIKTAAEPLSMAMSLDGKHIAVTTGASHHVDVFDAHTLLAESTHEVAREPRAAIFTRQGLLLVSHAAESRLSAVRVDPAAPAPPKDGVALGIGATFQGSRSDPARAARHADAMVRISSAEGERIIVPLVQNAPKEGAPPGGGYGGSSDSGSSRTFEVVTKPMPPMLGNDFGSIDPFPMAVPKVSIGMKQGSPIPRSAPPNRMSAFDIRTIDSATASSAVLADRSERQTANLLRRCLLPRAAVTTERARLLVACFGEDQVLMLDANAAIPSALGSLDSGRGPSAIARFDDAHVVVWAPLARKVSAFDIGQDGDRRAFVARTLDRNVAMDAQVLKGRELFHRNNDDRIAEDGLACATCHPDGRDDGLVWASPRGDRRTLTLAGSANRVATFGWGGEHATIDVHVKETVKRLRGKGLPQDDLDAIFAYVRSMHPVPAADVPDEPEEMRGAALFASSCASCHDPANGYTDHQKHAFGGAPATVTPSLLGASARSTLFHDGRFRSMEALLQSGTEMGGLGTLTKDDQDDLRAYLKTL